MSNLEQFHARASLLSGFGAASIMALWGWLNLYGFEFSFLPLIGYLTVSLLFQYVTPVLCFSAFYFGFPSRRQLTAKAGIGLALMALASYTLHIVIAFAQAAES